MFIRYNEIDALAFKGRNKKNPIFYYIDENFYYSNIRSFEKFFEKMIFNLEIIVPMKLQTKGYSPNRCIIEREKIEVMERAKKMGIYLMEENKDILFKNKNMVNKALEHNFYISISSKDFFINTILKPLLLLVKNNDKNEWINIENKGGLWRQLKNDESMPIGGEVSLNFTSGINMLKL